MFKAISKLATHSKRKRERSRIEKNIARNPSVEDTYLVSFPKSGITWLSFLIANTNLLLNGKKQRATWWNIHDYVTDIGLCRDLPPHPLSVPGGRFVKSHSMYHPHYHKVVYLVRDPRSSLASFYDMATKRDWFCGSMDEFLQSSDFGIPAWIKHVDGWLSRRGMGRIQFFRYEDLQKNPVSLLTHLYSLFGVSVDSTLLAAAVERSSFKNMRKEEELYKQHSHEKYSSFVFVRKGLTDDFASELTAEQIALIEKKCSHWMNVFDYQPSIKAIGSSALSQASPLAPV